MLFVLFCLISCCFCEIVNVDANPGDPTQLHPQDSFHHEEIKQQEPLVKEESLLQLENGGFISNIEDKSEDEQKKAYESLYGWLASEGTTASQSLSIRMR